MDLALKFDNVVVMRTLSKSYSLAAMRVGYLVGNPELIAALDKIKDSYNLDGVAQTLALAALNDTGYMRSNAEKIKATRSRLADELRALGFEVCQSATNFLWTIPPSGIDAQTYFEKLKQKNILIRYFSDQKISRYVRITVGTDVEIDKLLAETKEILKESDK
jgi:histidinol-phosphate aminotransferase